VARESGSRRCYAGSTSGSGIPAFVKIDAGRYANFIMVTWILVLGFSGYLLLRHKQGSILLLSPFLCRPPERF
jgi:hypothetical protein